MTKSDISTHLTLRFKYGNTTIFVFADELAPFSQIKEDLLETLRETQPKGLLSPPSSKPGYIALPGSVESIIVGTPQNVNDFSEGWTVIDTSSETGAKECPKSLGLKEADTLAFVIKSEGEETPEFYVSFSDLNALYPEDEEMEE